MSNSPSPLERVLSRLEGVQWCNGYVMARCPGHDDREPSLSVSEGDDGRALVHCFAGCSFEEIIAAAGLTAKDAFPEEPPSGPRRGGEFTPSENGRYVDTPAGCTLREYAEHKRLPVGFLREQHASEIPHYNGGPAVKMDYLDAEGAEVLCVRYRVSLDCKPKIKTRRGDKLCPGG